MTLRTRIVVSLVAVALILGLVGWFVANSQRGYLVSQLDGQLNVAIPSSLRLGGGRPPGQRNGNAPRPVGITQAPESALSELFVGGLHSDGELDELARPGPSDRGRPIVTLDDALRHAAEDLLLLARLDEKRPLSRADVDVASFLADAGLDAAARQPDRPVSVDSAAALDIVGDDARLRQVIGVLVDNVLVHTPATSKLSLRGARSADNRSVVLSLMRSQRSSLSNCLVTVENVVAK